MTVYCANRYGLFEHSCVYHATFVGYLHVCSFCVFCVWFISCLLCCAIHVKGAENMKSQILFKNDELFSCGVQNMIRKRLLEIVTKHPPQSLIKYIVSFVLKNTRFVLKNQIKFTLSTKSTMVNYKCQN